MKTSNGWRQPLRCAIDDSMYGRRIRPVRPTATPGLVIADWEFLGPEYSVTHRRSGLRIGQYHRSLPKAQQIAEQLGEVTDWTQSAGALAQAASDEEFMGSLAKVMEGEDDVGL